MQVSTMLLTTTAALLAGFALGTNAPAPEPGHTGGISHYATTTTISGFSKVLPLLAPAPYACMHKVTLRMHGVSGVSLGMYPCPCCPHPAALAAPT